MIKSGNNTGRRRNFLNHIRSNVNAYIFFIAFIVLIARIPFCAAENSVNIGEIADVFPFSAYHLSTAPTTARIADQGNFRLSQQLLISNSYTNETPSYLVDIEQYSLVSAIRYGYSENLEVGAKFNIDWQGGGFLDHSVNQWHDFFGLPQGGRENIEDNQNTVSFQNKNDEISNIDAHGYSFGKLSLEAKYLLSDLRTKNTKTTIHSILLLPVASDYYQQDSFDIALGPVFEYQASNFTITSGLYYTYINDTFEDGIKFNQHQVSSFVNFDIPLYENLSLTTSLWSASSNVQNVPKLPDYQTYLDIALSFPISTTNFVVGFRENPIPDDGTTDITFFLQMAENL
ncbi:MAG: DUF3187 family protein [Deltaproteobacteria bacterium]|nr:DUF3187 family protein [Deltaproteobacteria bacterium]